MTKIKLLSGATESELEQAFYEWQKTLKGNIHDISFSTCYHKKLKSIVFSLLVEFTQYR